MYSVIILQRELDQLNYSFQLIQKSKKNGWNKKDGKELDDAQKVIMSRMRELEKSIEVLLLY